jgi:hypothetical protein
VLRLGAALSLIALFAVLGGCTSDRIPRFARPAPDAGKADAGKPDASGSEEDAGVPGRDR